MQSKRFFPAALRAAAAFIALGALAVTPGRVHAQGVFGPGNLLGSSVTTGWHHVAIRQDGALNTRSLIVDGVEDVSSFARNSDGAGALWIGGANDTDEYFEGKVDEVVVYNRALSQAELELLAGIGGPISTPSSGLILHLPLDETSGGTVFDSTAQGHNGTINGAVSDAGGMVGGAYAFDGVDDFIEVPHTSELGFTKVQSFTMAAWIFVPTLPSSWSGVLTKSRDVAPWSGIWIAASNRWAFGAKEFTGVGNLRAPGALTPGWTHVAIEQDGPLGIRKIYVNGVRKAADTPRDGNGPGALWIGGAEGRNEFFSGKVDEVVLYNRPLTDVEIAGLAGAGGPITSPPPTDGLVAYYPLDDDDTTTTVVDASGNGRTGTRNGPTPDPAGGTIGGAFSFDGVDDRVEVPHHFSLAFASFESFTLAAWIFVGTPPGAFQGVITKSRDAGQWYGIWIGDENLWTYGSKVLLQINAAQNWMTYD